MEAFRAKPVPVPEDWWYKMVKLKKKVGDQTHALRKEIGSKELLRIFDSEEMTLNKTDALAYFETVVSVPEVAAATKKSFQFYENNPHGDDPEEWGKVRADFLRWWIFSRFDINQRAASRALSTYKLATRSAFKEYSLSGNINKAYEYLHRDLDKYGFTDGAVT